MKLLDPRPLLRMGTPAVFPFPVGRGANGQAHWDQRLSLPNDGVGLRMQPWVMTLLLGAHWISGDLRVPQAWPLGVSAARVW